MVMTRRTPGSLRMNVSARRDSASVRSMDAPSGRFMDTK